MFKRQRIIPSKGGQKQTRKGRTARRISLSSQLDGSKEKPPEHVYQYL